ncbi:putative lipid-binding transport protein (Tim44 family) [Vibrio sp. ES.051]|uniref:Tim44 domain-containing protein n=1 Tax=Vibrio sp. ES.051 TaxID=1761909 RepID=UPI000BF73F3F|nr:Tim44 domain-containing protein [Vibrio sp. ES.051]PFG45908.1 putative lipid-binding transport protein (Tim44 family) [Vibrio sp. ES.051]
MKRLFSIVALLMFTVAVTPIAEAKRFGGGKSFGKSYKTAPAPKQQQQNTNTIGKEKTAKSSSKKGLMGGLLGGLLAGGLLAAFFGGAFEGIQFMDILIIGLIAFFIFKLMRGMLGAKQGSMNQHRHQPAFGGNTSKFEQPNMQNFEQQPNSNTGGFTGFGSQSDVPHNYPPGFDQAAFVNGAREHYRILQGAWNHNQLDTIEEYVSPSLLDDLKAERAKLEGEQHTDVMYVDAEIVRADYDANKAQLSLQFSGRYRDAVEGVEESIEDIWHLERDLTVPNAPWLIVGIQG